ncbi:hypothetical protein [Haloferula sp. BvORR071]|uniref:hypothetical protein n=1 Tax=Haloferula sp. BvORR071 TaxID=1396141 RepID=UPI00054E6679|nr:hypothetical protein [Haloferula sp. BvORR071]
MIPKLNIVSALAALVFFFLPWVSIECNGRRMGSQTGVQMIVGSATSAAPSTPQQPGEFRLSERKESLGTSYLAAAALIAVASALLISFAALVKGDKDSERGGGILCVFALAFLLTQAALGFPAKREMEKVLEKQRDPGAEKGPHDDVGKQIAQQLVASVDVKPTQWFYLELAALGLPALILGNALLDRLKARGS